MHKLFIIHRILNNYYYQKSNNYLSLIHERIDCFPVTFQFFECVPENYLLSFLVATREFMVQTSLRVASFTFREGKVPIICTEIALDCVFSMSFLRSHYCQSNTILFRHVRTLTDILFKLCTGTPFFINLFTEALANFLFGVLIKL